MGSIPKLGSYPGGGNGNPLVFLPGKSHGQRILVGYSPWGRKIVGYDLVTKQQQIWAVLKVERDSRNYIWDIVSGPPEVYNPITELKQTYEPAEK